MRIIIIFLRLYPSKSLVALIALLFAGIAEGFGFSTLVPLLGIVIKDTGKFMPDGATGSASTLEHMVREIFGIIGLTPTILNLLVALIISMTLKAFLVYTANKKVGYMVAQVATDLRLGLIRALFATRWEYFIQQPVGRFTNAMATEAKRAGNAYLSGIKAVAAAIDASIYGIIVLLVSWKLAFAAVAIGATILLIFKYLVTKAKRSGKRQTKFLRSLMAQMTDNIIMIKPLKTMARESMADAVLVKKVEHLKKALKKQVYSKEALSAFQEPIMVVFLAAGLYIALVVVKIPVASVLVMVFMMSKLFKRLQNIQKEYQNMAINESAYWSILEKTEEAKDMKESSLGDKPPVLKHSIRLENVSFTYENRLILQNVSLKFPVGSFSAIVGPSGIGKTTIVDLISGLLRPQKGEIWIDDLPLEKIDLKAWRRLIGYVPQETFLLHDTIFFNITLGDEELSEADAENALRAAGALEFVKAIPRGIHSIAGERGHKLSGGQRQRIAIARAIVHKPKLLILDEATTALDPDSEAAICETLHELSGQLTILAISHQPAVLNVADRAYRLEGRSLEEISTGSACNLRIKEVNGQPGNNLEMVLGKYDDRIFNEMT
jgi:ATP-binding cassette subfamily C protein